MFHIPIIIWLPSGLMPHKGKVKAGQWDTGAIFLLVSKTGKCFIRLDNLHKVKKGSRSCVKVVKCCSWEIPFYPCLYLCIWDVKYAFGSLTFQKWSPIMPFPLSWQIYLVVCTVNGLERIWTYRVLYNALNSNWTGLKCILHPKLLDNFLP